MPLELDGGIVTKILLAALFGAILGMERELRRKPAGLRTNMFICIGSALFTLLSSEMAHRMGGDPVRIAAQLITGIGFIGAGAIIRDRGSVVGLTTAAIIFVNASIGMATGAGMYGTAGFVTLVALVALVGFGWFEERFTPRRELMNFRLTAASLDSVMPQAQAALAEMRVSLERVRIRRQHGEHVFEFDAALRPPQAQQLLRALSELDARCEMGPVDASAR
jgi:putative Mg2+ transporter-C (MgtC) family protein